MASKVIAVESPDEELVGIGWDIFIENADGERRYVAPILVSGPIGPLLEQYQPDRVLAKFAANGDLTDTELEILNALG